MTSLSARPLVLVADDDVVMRALVIETLQRNGCDVVTASDGREVIDVASEARFDAVVIDVLMPGTNGLQATRELRAQPHQISLPIIVVSGTDDPRLRAQVRSVGADDFIAKPFSPSELVASIRKHLRPAHTDPPLTAGPAVCPWPAPTVVNRRASQPAHGSAALSES